MNIMKMRILDIVTIVILLYVIILSILFFSQNSKDEMEGFKKDFLCLQVFTNTSECALGMNAFIDERIYNEVKANEEALQGNK